MSTELHPLTPEQLRIAKAMLARCENEGYDGRVAPDTRLVITGEPEWLHAAGDMLLPTHPATALLLMDARTGAPVTITSAEAWAANLALLQLAIDTPANPRHQLAIRFCLAVARQFNSLEQALRDE